MSDWLSVALPKGRLGEQAYRLLERAGYECPGVLEQGRRLILENQDRHIRYFWVKPVDVAIYVERGTEGSGDPGETVRKLCWISGN